MFYFILSGLFIMLLICFAVFFYMNNLHKNNVNFKQLSLIDYLLLNYKKRNFNKINSKNITKKHNYTIKTAKYNINYVKYKKLKVIHYKTQLKNSLKEKHKTFVEQKNMKLTLSLLNLLKKIEPIINKNKLKYRSVKNECLIETVASSFSHSILLKENFNVFESFKDLTKVIRVYKKEAEILNVLIIANLINLYLLLQKDIKKIKANINKGAKTKSKTILNNKPNAFIYGAYLFNQSSTKLLYNKKESIILATTSVLNELDHIYYKQRIIFNYISYLSKSLT